MRLVPIELLRISMPGEQCHYCGTFRAGYRNAQGIPECPPSTCLACGAVVCQGWGLGNGTCPICYRGLLTGWFQGGNPHCGYKYCKEEPVAHQARVGLTCRKHLKGLRVDREGWREVE